MGNLLYVSGTLNETITYDSHLTANLSIPYITFLTLIKGRSFLFSGSLDIQKYILFSILSEKQYFYPRDLRNLILQDVIKKDCTMKFVKIKDIYYHKYG
jgi:hypothetical protein